MNIDNVIALYSGFHFPDELKMLNRLAAGVTEGVIVAIGSYRGQSDCALAYDAQAPVYCIDARSGSIGEDTPFGDIDRTYWMQNVLSIGVAEKVRPINLTSAEVADTWTYPVGMLFLDASHDYDSVLSDLDMWVPTVIDGGLVALHDVGNAVHPDVDRALAEWAGSFELVERADITSVFRKVGTPIPTLEGSLFGAAHGIHPAPKATLTSKKAPVKKSKVTR